MAEKTLREQLEEYKRLSGLPEAAPAKKVDSVEDFETKWGKVAPEVKKAVKSRAKDLHDKMEAELNKIGADLLASMKEKFEGQEKKLAFEIGLVIDGDGIEEMLKPMKVGGFRV